MRRIPQTADVCASQVLSAGNENSPVATAWECKFTYDTYIKQLEMYSVNKSD